MKIIIKGTNIKLDDAIYDCIEEKIGGLGKFLPDIDPDLAEARVEVGKTTRHHQKGEFFRAEINLSLPARPNNRSGGPSKLLRAEAAKKDIFMAITTIKDEIQRQIKNYKSEPMAKYKKGARQLKDFKNVIPH